MQRPAGFLILAAVLFAFGSPAMAAAAIVLSVEVEGTAFRVTLSDGRIVAQDQLRGDGTRFGYEPR